MNKNSKEISQTSLIIRLLGGAYLLYLVWDLRGAIQESPLYLIAVIAFGAAGLFLLIHSALKLLRREYAEADAAPTTEESEETTDE